MSLPVVVLFLASAGWGLTWLPIKYFNENGLGGPFLVFVAFGAVAVALFPIFVKQYSHWRQHLSYVLLIAFFGGLANLAFQLAISYGDIIRVMILFYLLPVWSVIGGRIFLRETIDRLRLLAVVLALAGAFLVLGGVEIFNYPPTWVDLLAVTSGFALAMNNIAFRASCNLNIKSKISVMFLGCVIMVGGYLSLVDRSVPDYDASIIGLAILYGLFWITLITLGTQWAVTKIEASRASIIIVTELVVAVVSSAIILQQSLTSIEVIGAILVTSAAIIEGARDSLVKKFENS